MLRGEIYEVDFGVGVGRGVGGFHPAVVVSSDNHNVGPVSLIVLPGVPFAIFPYRSQAVPVTAAESGLSADLAFLCHLIRAVDPTRVSSGPLGQLPAARMADIDRTLRSIIDLHPPPRSTAPAP